MGDHLAIVLHDVLTLLDGGGGEHAVAVDLGTALCDLAGSHGARRSVFRGNGGRGGARAPKWRKRYNHKLELDEY